MFRPTKWPTSSSTRFLTGDQKKKREEEIVAKEKEVTDTRYKYFGPEGELYKKRQSLMKPIQEDVYNAVKAVAEEKGYQVIFDRASSQSIVFAEGNARRNSPTVLRAMPEGIPPTVLRAMPEEAAEGKARRNPKPEKSKKFIKIILKNNV